MFESYSVVRFRVCKKVDFAKGLIENEGGSVTNRAPRLVLRKVNKNLNKNSNY